MKIRPSGGALVLASIASLILGACSGTILDPDGGTEGGAAGRDGGFGDAGVGEGGLPSDSGSRCTPGNYVFCRCADRAEGTKRCNADGMSFEPCSPCAGE